MAAQNDDAGERRRNAARAFDDALDRAARTNVLRPGVRFCVGGHFYCTLSDNPRAWGAASVFERHLHSYVMGCTYGPAMALDFPRSLRRLLSRRASNISLEVVDALNRQFAVPASVRVHPLPAAPTPTGILMQLALEDAAEIYTLERLLFDSSFSLFASDAGVYEVRATCEGGARIAGRVDRARYDWWRTQTDGSFDDEDVAAWNPIQHAVNDITWRAACAARRRAAARGREAPVMRS